MKTNSFLKFIQSEAFSYWLYRIWSIIGFYFSTMVVWAIIGLVLKKIEWVTLNYDESYISIILTTIIISVRGDKIVYWWFRIQGIIRIFQYKDCLINQNNVRIFIYIAYFILLIGSNIGVEFETTEFWIKAFATFLAFDKIRSHWDLLWDKKFSA